MKRILLVDYMGSVHYHFHRKERDPCYGFLLGIQQIIRQVKPYKTFLLLEGGKSRYRLEKHPEYKAQREANRKKWTAAEQAAYKKFKKNAGELAKDILPLFGLEPLQVWGCEADDLAAYLANHADTQECQVLLLSADKDWHQLLRPGVAQGAYDKLMNAGFPSPTGLWMGAKAFQEAYGIPVEQWIWVKCLAGDDGDNVKGFPQIGEGTALSLLQKYGSISAIKSSLADLHVPRMRQVAKDAMIEDFDRVYRNYELMNLHFDDVEEMAIFGQEGIDYLDHVLNYRLVDKKPLDVTTLSEVAYEMGWLELLEESFLQPFS